MSFALRANDGPLDELTRCSRTALPLHCVALRFVCCAPGQIAASATRHARSRAANPNSR